MTDEEHTKTPSAYAKPSRHAVIMRGVVTPILGLLAVACVVLGLLNATEWKPNPDVTASAKASGTRYVLVDPGVLGMVDRDATLTVTASGSREAEPAAEGAEPVEPEVCVALASGKDATGWLQGERYVRVTGMQDWSHMTTATAKPHGSAAGDEGAVAFKDSDMWTDVVCGEPSATLRVNGVKDGQIALVDLGVEDGQASLEFSWVRQTLPDFAMPFYFGAGILAIMAVLTASVFAMPAHKRRKKVVEKAEGEEEPENGETSTSRDGHGTRHAEVGFGEALAGTFLWFASLFHRSSHRGKHGGSGRVAASSGGSGAAGKPVVIDPTSRNMVAEAQTDAGADADAEGAAEAGEPSGEETTVISAADLAAYFARFASESEATGDGTDAKEGDDE